MECDVGMNAAPDELGRVVEFVSDDFGEHLEVLAEPLPVLGGDHLEEVVHARRHLEVWYDNFTV